MSKDKKKLILTGGSVLLIVLLLAVIISNVSYSKTDALKFKREYEAVNGEKSSSGNVYQNLTINKKNKIKYTDLSGALEFLKSGTGLIYFGYPKCPWCRGVLPTLLNVVDASNLENLLYVDMTDLRDVYELKNEEIIKTKDASAEYYEILRILDEYLDEYVLKDDDSVEYKVGEKRIFVPLVVAVKNGIVMDAHTGSVALNDGQSPYDLLTDVQLSELKVIFDNLLEETKEAEVCDEHC